jgi:hypothetical protein
MFFYIGHQFIYNNIIMYFHNEINFISLVKYMIIIWLWNFHIFFNS